MTKLVTIEELPQYAPGELKLDSSAVGRPDFRMRVFRYAPSDICVPLVNRGPHRAAPWIAVTWRHSQPVPVGPTRGLPFGWVEVVPIEPLAADHGEQVWYVYRDGHRG